MTDCRSRGLPPMALWARSTVLRFCVAGALNTGFGYAAFLACLAAGMPVGAALALSTVAGVAFNFRTAERMVFGSRGLRTLPRFVAVYAALAGVDWAALRLLRSWDLPPWAGQGALVLPLAGLAFLAQRHLVFRPVRG